MAGYIQRWRGRRRRETSEGSFSAPDPEPAPPANDSPDSPGCGGRGRRENALDAELVRLIDVLRRGQRQLGAQMTLLGQQVTRRFDEMETRLMADRAALDQSIADLGTALTNTGTQVTQALKDLQDHITGGADFQGEIDTLSGIATQLQTLGQAASTADPGAITQATQAATAATDTTATDTTATAGT